MANIYNDERSIEPKMIAIMIVMAIGHVHKIFLSILSSWHGVFCFTSMGQKNVMMHLHYSVPIIVEQN